MGRIASRIAVCVLHHTVPYVAPHLAITVVVRVFFILAYHRCSALLSPPFLHTHTQDLQHLLHQDGLLLCYILLCHGFTHLADHTSKTMLTKVLLHTLGQRSHGAVRALLQHAVHNVCAK